MRATPGLVAALAVGLLAFVAHLPALGAGWVYDDHRLIVQNPALDRVDPAGWLLDPTSASAAEGIQPDVWRPLRTASFALDRALYGRERPFAWHLESLLWHVAASLLVLRVLRGLAAGFLAPLAGAALFAVHPATSEVVAWVSSRGDLLAMVLGLGALVVTERAGALRTAAGVVLMALACLAKEAALVLPGLLLLRDLALPLARRPALRTTLARVGAFGLVAFLYLLARGAVVGDPAQAAEFPGGSRLAAARGMLAGLAWYAQALAWPRVFSFDLHLPLPLSFGDPGVVLGLGLLLSLLLAGLCGLVRGPRLLTFAAWGALACLVPVSNVIVPLKAVVAERFLYPVLLPAAAGLALAVGAALARRGAARVLVPALAALATLALVPITWSRDAAWADDLSLWTRVIRERPDHMRAYEGLGFEMLRSRPPRIREAQLAYTSYLEYNPADAKAMRLLGDAYGETAKLLRERRPSPEEFLSPEGLHLATRAQLETYQRALVTWDRIGLVRGRGSVALLRGTFQRILEALWDVGDLDQAKWANDALIVLEGATSVEEAERRLAIILRGPGLQAPPEEVMRRAGFARRLARVRLAQRAMHPHVVPGQHMRPGDHEARRLERAVVVRDVGIDPGLTDAEARRALLPILEGLAREPQAAQDGAVHHNLVRLLIDVGEYDRAEAVLRVLLRQRPDDALALDLVEEILGARGPGRLPPPRGPGAEDGR